MILYKYLSPSRLNVLTESMIRYTQLDDFNDIFELNPNIDGLVTFEDIEERASRNFERLVLEEYENHPEIHPLLDKECFLRLAREKARSVNINETVDMLQRELSVSFLDKIRACANQTLGALSLSESNDNQLMWSHYADGHRGYVLGFDSSKRFFNRKVSKDDGLRHLRPVIYTTELPKLQFKTVTVEDLFFIKGHEWQYESEWRMLLPLSESSKTIPLEPFPIHLFQFPAEAISQRKLSLPPQSDVGKQIIFGDRLYFTVLQSRYS